MRLRNGHSVTVMDCQKLESSKSTEKGSADSQSCGIAAIRLHASIATSVSLRNSIRHDHVVPQSSRGVARERVLTAGKSGLDSESRPALS
jgi:hypothetical protein